MDVMWMCVRWSSRLHGRPTLTPSTIAVKQAEWERSDSSRLTSSKTKQMRDVWTVGPQPEAPTIIWSLPVGCDDFFTRVCSSHVGTKPAPALLYNKKPSSWIKATFTFSAAEHTWSTKSRRNTLFKKTPPKVCQWKEIEPCNHHLPPAVLHRYKHSDHL